MNDCDGIVKTVRGALVDLKLGKALHEEIHTLSLFKSRGRDLSHEDDVGDNGIGHFAGAIDIFVQMRIHYPYFRFRFCDGSPRRRETI